MINSRLGICSWSIDRADVVRALSVAGEDVGVEAVQIGFFLRSGLAGADSDSIRRAADTAGVRLVGAFLGFEGEDYSSIAAVAASGGYAADETLADRMARTRDASRLTAAVGCEALAIHHGSIPDDPEADRYGKLLARVGEAADVAASDGLRLLLETGRESAATLAGFIGALGRDNVGVNFDPANFVVYGTDDPVSAVSVLKGLIEQVHLKDAMASSQPGIEFGSPAALGAGDARIPRVLSKLRAVGYGGTWLVESKPERGGLAALRGAIDYANSMLM